jgi:hypothetical protein
MQQRPFTEAWFLDHHIGVGEEVHRYGQAELGRLITGRSNPDNGTFAMTLVTRINNVLRQVRSTQKLCLIPAPAGSFIGASAGGATSGRVWWRTRKGCLSGSATMRITEPRTSGWGIEKAGWCRSASSCASKSFFSSSRVRPTRTARISWRGLKPGLTTLGQSRCRLSGERAMRRWTEDCREYCGGGFLWPDASSLNVSHPPIVRLDYRVGCSGTPVSIGLANSPLGLVPPFHHCKEGPAMQRVQRCSTSWHHPPAHWTCFVVAAPRAR